MANFSADISPKEVLRLFLVFCSGSIFGLGIRLAFLTRELLNLLTKHIVELSRVLLHANVDRLAIELEGLDEAVGDEVGALRFLQVSEHSLQLVDGVVF